jgi:hypothetical protein
LTVQLTGKGGMSVTILVEQAERFELIGNLKTAKAAVHLVSFGTFYRFCYGAANPSRPLLDAAVGPDRLWVTDITYIPTWAGFLFSPSSSMRGVPA